MNPRPILIAFALLLSFTATAQSVPDRAAKRAKQRAEYKAQNKVDRSVDEAVDDAFNSIGNLFKKKKKKAEPAPDTNSDAQSSESSPAANPYGGMIGNEDAAPYEPFTNEYSVSLDMEITEIKKNGKTETNTMSMAVTTDQYAVLVKDQNGTEISRMIFNTQDGKTTMITTDKKGKKTGFRMKMPGVRKLAADAAEETADRFEFVQTGERKTIDGYGCEKIIVTDKKEGTITTSWVTQDLSINSKDVFAEMMGALGNKVKTGPNSVMERGFDGFPILSITEDKGKTYETHFSNIKVGEENIDRSLLDVSGIEIQSIGF
ncbi:DUF4412 domain-containing protein [Neolewinella aurantiaca]|uniref:DUF4412 domain-containing protein n=1 Tax=Neolewinella aurantiaca TaxID=2602767 RepID=A0A5C7FI06_9BACT|nr:DUF4412 domain-containing protein [Neolewinella aurantiaca]TXF89386.1 DUF4412 domain-containing protein [Neolewinella aurantiaca]